METQASTSKIGLRYGLISGLILIIYSLILQVAGLASNQKLGWLSYIILAVIIYMAHNAFKQQGNGYLSIGQGLGIGMIISAISGVFSGVFLFVYLKFVDNSMLEEIRDRSYEQLESKGMSDEQIEQAMSMSEKFMSPGMLFIFAIIGTLFFGFIVSLIVSLFTKKSNPEVSA